MAKRDPECEECLSPVKTIDDCYNDVLKALIDKGKIQTVSTHLAALTTNHDRALYIHNVVKNLGFLPVVMTNPKNDHVSMHYRFQGNVYFKQKKNFEAWQCYNFSLLYAHPSSENFIYAISNRSAVFYELGKYEECIEDLNFLFRSTFPEKLGDKLRSRKKRCESFLAAKPKNKKDKTDKAIDEILSIKGPRDEKYVCASSKLKVVYTKEMGRHVVANENIAVGEVLAQEDPYLVVLLKCQFIFTCAYCLSKTLNLYPCLTCNYTMYCSVTCREEAFKAYHQVECPLMVNLLAMDFTKLEWLALRTMIKSRTDCKGWYDTFKVASDAEANIHTERWGCVKKGDKWIYDSKNYASVHTLATNVRKRSVSDLFRKSLTAAVLAHFLAVINFLDVHNDSTTAAKANEYVAGVLLHHIMTSPTNMHDISTVMENEDGNYIDECSIASGAYPFLSLLNHSCAPNVVRCTKLGTAKMSLVAIRPIKKGMQIFDNYGIHHALLSREERQSSLSFQYKFTCTCEACVNDWPTHFKLKKASGLPIGIFQKKDECLAPEVLAKLMRGDKKTAVKYYKPLCHLIEAFEAQAPCKELAECQEALKQCLAIFEGMMPHCHGDTIQWRAFPPCQAIGGPPHIPNCYGPFMFPGPN